MAIPKSILLVFLFFCFIKKIQLSCSTLHCPKNERNALFDFKQGLIDQTNRLSSWVGQDCCKWQGVSCNNITGHVVMLDLRNPFPIDTDRLDYFGHDKVYSEACLIAVDEVNPSLSELKHLNYLDLSWNNFSGITIPKFFGKFSELTYLNLSNAWFGGIVPHHLGNLSALHSLDLGSNYDLRYFTSYNIPYLVINTLYWSSSLVSLQHLDMSRVYLSNIPLYSFQAITSLPSLLELSFSNCFNETNPLPYSNIENLTSLTFLDLSYNYFQGPISSVIRNMTSLKVLLLSYNELSSNGSFFDELKNLNKLEVLDLSNNKFEGNMNELGFPNFSSPSIGDNVLELRLSGNRFTGFLPNWLHQLKSHLNIIDLSNNLFEGEIPISFGALQSLEELYLANNKLSGHIPSSLTKLSTLQVLDLSFNSLSGQIPASLGRMSALRYLNLGNIQLSGDLVPFGKLSQLIKLLLDHNQFNGSIPKSFGQLSQLNKLFLHNNRLHGVVSELHFARLSKLKDLDLSMNSLTIKLRSGWVPPFQLESVWLESCYVGHLFPDWLQTQTGLKNLFMSTTGISDFIPNWFQNLTFLVRLDLSSNQIYGKVPNFTGNMVELYLSSNRFEGPLPRFPSSLEYLDLSNNRVHEPIQTDFGYTLPHLGVLLLSNNRINGTIPKSLCKMLSLYLLDFSKNNLSGVLPHCLGDLHPMLVIDFTSNNLSGTIHWSFFQYSSLLSLHLSKNNFHGELPLSLQNCKYLEVLDVSDNNFSGEIPTWIGQTLQYSLKILKLSSNKYSGGLSPKLCNLNELQVFDVAGNNLSGNIPSCFGNFNAMLFNQTHSVTSSDSRYEDKLTQIIKGRELEYTKNLQYLTILDLSNNNFVGKIPEQLANLSGLFCLNLSRNHFTGSISMKIGQMRSLESLDLSNNQLSGTIPQSISAVTTLSYMNLSNNNLSGPIPSGNQLQTLNDPSIYDGNSELCGLPLEKKCTIVDRKEKRKGGDENEDGDGFITMWFYIGMAWGCVVGFWGFCGVLLFKKNWRYAYFRFANDIVDRLFYTIAKWKV